MKKLVALLLGFVALKTTAQVIVSQPQVFQKYIRVKGSLFADSAVLLSDTTTNKVAPLKVINQYFQKKGASGTVTSVGLSMPGMFQVINSPIINSGTIGVAFNSEPQNTFLAAPSASSGPPGFRGIVASDLPAGIGTVTNVSSSTTDIAVANPTTTPVITLNNVNGVPISRYDPTSSIQTQLNGKQASLGYTAENIANKETSVTASSTLYPTGLAVQNYVTGFNYIAANAVSGSCTNCNITYVNGQITVAANGSGGGLTTSNFVTNEVPSGTINGSNVTFTLANTPTSGTVQLYLSGIHLQITTDYTISSGTITMVSAPLNADTLLASYMK